MEVCYDSEVDIRMEESPRNQTPEFQPPPTTSGRQRRFPRQYQDFLPNSTTHLPHMPPKPSAPAQPTITHSQSPSPIVESFAPTVLKTDPDEFGIYRVYESYPSTNLDDGQDLESRCDAPGFATAAETQPKRWWTGFGCGTPDLLLRKAHDNFFAPFLNATVFRLMNWFYAGSSTKSITELQSLVDDVLLAPDFKISDLTNFNARRELQRLDADAGKDSDSSSPFNHENGWRQSTVKIKIPAEKMCMKEDDAPVLEIPGVYHRNLIEVITTALQDDNAKTFHYTPFSLFWQPTPQSTPERLYSEIYNSDAFIEEHARISRPPPRVLYSSMNVQLQQSCFGQTQPISLNSDLHRYGRSTFSLAINPSMIARNLLNLQHIMLHICLRYLSITLIFSLATSNISILASRYFSGPLYGVIWSTGITQHDDSSETRDFTSGLGITSRSRVFGRLRAWDRY